MAKKDADLREPVLVFYREELRRRYQLENVKEFRHFAKVTDEQINRLREYFLERIYPAPGPRKELDEAFDHLNELLRSPRKLQPLMGAALTSLWRMGSKLPAAISAGRSTVEAYKQTRVLEDRLVEEAIKHNLSPQDVANRPRMLKLLVNVPEKDVINLIRDVLSLFHALTNVEMLRVASAFMRQCVATMRKRSDLYDENNIKGVLLGLEVLEGGINLFEGMDRKDLAAVVEGIYEIEMRWYRSVQSEAAA